MDRETLRKLAATQMPTSMNMIQRTAQSPSAAPPIAPPQSVTVQPTGANKNAALRTNQDANVPSKKTDTFDHAFKEQSPDTHKTDIQCSSMGGKVGSEKLKGGLADGKKPSDFDAKELNKGMKVEREHSTEENVQKEVAMDHLTEDPAYYEKLKKIEKKAGFLDKLRQRGREYGPMVTYMGDDASTHSSLGDVEDYLREHHKRLEALERHLVKSKRDFTIDNGGKFPEYSLRGEVKEAAGPVRMSIPGHRQMPTAPSRGAPTPVQAGQNAAMQQFGIQAAPPVVPGQNVAAASAGMKGKMFEPNYGNDAPLELAMDPMKARTQFRGASYNEGIKEALEKFAIAPLIGAGLAAAAPHVGRFLASKAAPMLLQGAMGGIQNKMQGGSFLGGAVPGAISGAVPGVGGMAAGMGAGMLMNR